MEAVLFCGIQACGKSSFYQEKYFHTHVRISLDQIRTRHRERRLLAACIETQQPFVIDNTNPTVADRKRYFELLKPTDYRVVGFYFQSKVERCLLRNANRETRVPDVAILATAKRLQIPTRAEGFDALFYVKITDDGFVTEEWKDEV